MKSFEHHARRLLDRMVQAETVTDPDKARKIVRKAEKHREKMRRIPENSTSRGKHNRVQAFRAVGIILTLFVTILVFTGNISLYSYIAFLVYFALGWII
jgi:Flp pilus assembly protein TadB